MADPDGLAELLLVALDGAAFAVGKWRYGDDADPLKASADGRREIKKAALVYLRAMNVQMTPGQALVAAMAAAYLPATLDRELSGKAIRGPFSRKRG